MAHSRDRVAGASDDTRRARSSSSRPRRRAGLYLRRSNKSSGGRDVSIEEQDAICRHWCDTNDCDVFTVWEELGSGTSGEDREEFMSMILTCEAKPRQLDVLVMIDISRFSRMALDEAGAYLWRLRKAEVDLVPVHEAHQVNLQDPESYISLLIAARKHSESTGRRSAAGHVMAIMRGCWPGGPAPYGFRLVPHPDPTGRGPQNTKLEVIEEQAAVVRRVFQHYLDGLSPRQVTQRLNDPDDPAHCPSPKGKTWAKDAIKRMLGNPVYMGALVRNQDRPALSRKGKKQARFYVGTIAETARGRVPIAIPVNDPRARDGIFFPDVFPRIVSADVFTAAQAMRESRSTTRTGGKPSLLSGLIRCGVCRGGTRQDGTTPEGGKRYHYVRCLRRDRFEKKDRTTISPNEPHHPKKLGACALVSVRSDRLLEVVLDAVKNEVMKFEDGAVAAAARDKLASRTFTAVVDVEKLARKRTTLLERRKRLLLSVEDGQTDEIIEKDLADLAGEARRLGGEIERAQAQKAKATDLDALIERALAQAARLKLPTSDEGREALRQLLRGFVQKVELLPAPVDSRTRPVLLDIVTLPGVESVTGTGGRHGKSEP